jgi:biopolymer transport protein ExbD
MTIRFQCPHCESIRNVHERMSGKELRCPDCESMLRIPNQEEISKGLVRVVPIEPAISATTATSNTHSIAIDDPFQTQPDVGIDQSKRQRDSSLSDENLDADDSREDDLNAESFDEFEVEDDEFDEPTTFTFGKNAPKDEIDMTAMVDVTFLLLIFFMVTASFTSEKAIQQKASMSDKASQNSVPDQTEVNETVRILIDEFNAYTIIFPDGDEREASSKQELLGILAMAELEGSSDEASTMAVVAHEDSIHAAVIAALDAGREKGFSSFQVSVVENFD